MTAPSTLNAQVNPVHTLSILLGSLEERLVASTENKVFLPSKFEGELTISCTKAPSDISTELFLAIMPQDATFTEGEGAWLTAEEGFQARIDRNFALTRLGKFRYLGNDGTIHFYRVNFSYSIPHKLRGMITSNAGDDSEPLWYLATFHYQGSVGGTMEIMVTVEFTGALKDRTIQSLLG